jgi:O-antigen/teichoic acid export membrane protein
MPPAVVDTDTGAEADPETEAEVARARSTKSAVTGIRGSSILMVGRAISMAANFVIQLLIVNHLSKTGYGAFAYALSLVNMVVIVITLGLDRSITRFVAIYDERREYAKSLGTIVMQLTTIVSLGTSAVLLVVGLQGWLTGRLIDDEQAITMLVILIALAPIQALDDLCQNLFAVFAKARAIFFRRHILQPALRLTVVALLVATGEGPEFLAAGYVVVGLIGVVLYAAMLVRLLRQNGVLARFRQAPISFPFREVLAFTIPLLTSDLVFVLTNTSGDVILGWFEGVVDVASLRAILPVAGVNHLVFTSFGVLFTPLAARLLARGDDGGVRNLYWQTAIWVAVLTFPLFTLTFSLAGPLTVALFGERYESSGTLLALTSLGQYFGAALGFNGLTLKVYARLRALVVLNLISGVVNVVLNLVLISQYGALGAAISLMSTLIVHNLLKQVALWRTTGISFFDWHYARVYVLVAVCAGGLLAIQIATDPPLVVGVVLAAAASAAVLLFSRGLLEIDRTFPELRRFPGSRLLLGPSKDTR